jgi:RNA polymerase sigma factor (sigma-70 family)
METDHWATVVIPWDLRNQRTGAARVDKTGVADMVRRAADGDRGAWEVIVEDFSGLLWSVCRGYRLSQADAAEVVQTVWLRLLENLGRIREPEHLGGWLTTTARRESLRQLRLRGHELLTDDETRFSGTSVSPGSLSPGDDPVEAALRDDRDQRLWRAFEGLPERCRRLLRLLVVLTPPYTEVAAEMDMPVGSIGPTRARCLDRLRRLLHAEDPSDVAEAW